MNMQDRPADRVLVATVVLAVAALLCFIQASPVFATDQDFSMVIFPDTQYVVRSPGTIWNSMCHWVVENQAMQNIRAVLSVGDITDSAADTQFELASAGFGLIEKAGIPCVPILGNHDYDFTMVQGREVRKFDAWFGPKRFVDKAWYGGNFEGSNANYHVELTVDTRKFIVLALEFFPRQETLSWASSIIDAHADAEVILLTHGYLNSDGTRTKDKDAYGPSTYLSGNASSGDDLWNNLIRKKPNVRAVICGHQIGGPYTAHRSDVADSGNMVHQIFNNYQTDFNGGDGWVGLLNFHTSRGTVEVSYFRTYAASGLGYDPRSPRYTLIWPPLINSPK